MAMVLAWGACGGGGLPSGPLASTLNATPAGTYDLAVNFYTGGYGSPNATYEILSGSGVILATVVVNQAGAGPLAAGASQTSAYTYSAQTQGSHTVLFFVDKDNFIVESNKSNNTLQKSFTVNGVPTPTATATPPGQPGRARGGGDAGRVVGSRSGRRATAVLPGR